MVSSRKAEDMEILMDSLQVIYLFMLALYIIMLALFVLCQNIVPESF